MKKTFLCLLTALITVTAMAVPAKKGQWKTLRLTDGTEIRATLIGDEHGHYWKSEDGRAFMESNTADVYVAVDAQAIARKARARRQQANATRAKRLPLHRKASASYTGKKKGLILLVNFSNKQFQNSHDNALYQRIANEKNFSEGYFQGSMCDYFLAQSRGLFELDFDVVGPLTVSKAYSYYGENDREGNDKHPGEMVIEAIELAKSQVTDWNQYDWDNDGEIDQVYVVYAGYGEADGGASSTIWPHAYTLEEAKYYGDGTGPHTIVEGLKVNTYACGSELSYGASIAGIGTMCHEFSHCLGYPDFYDIDYSGGQGMCSWDLMDQGSYNGDGFLPAGYTSYERWVAGWTEPIVLEEEDQEVSGMKALQDGGESYIIYNQRNRNEYFMLENRQLTGWDAELPGKGLLILHVDYSEKVWAENTPNDDPKHQRMTWIPADNKYQKTMYDGTWYVTDEGMKNDPFPYNNNNAFNKDTKPAAELYNKNTDGTKFLSSSVENIKQNADGTIAFSFVANYSNSDTTVVVPPEVGDYLFYESFNKCEGTGGNDDDWSSSVASSKLNADNEGWEAEGIYGGYQCARFGSSKKSGEATSPAFTVGNESVLTFKAAAWGVDSPQLSVSADGASVVIEPATFTMKNCEWSTFTARISGAGTIKLVFTPAKRFFLDEVKVVDASTTSAIQSVEARPADNHIYSLDGRLAGTRLSELKHGIYIINGKKVIR